MRSLAVIAVMTATAAAQPAGSGSAKIIQIPLDESAPKVTAAASPSEVKLGTRFTVFVTATYDPGVEVNLAEPVQLGGDFEVRRRASTDRDEDGKHVREWQLEVYAWELGDLVIPPIGVTFTAGGHAGQVPANPAPVRVVGELGDVDDPKLLRESAPPVRLTSRDWFWIWISGSAFMVAAVVTGYLVQRSRRRRRVVRLVGAFAPAAPRRIDMTSERALERLLAIEQSGVLDRDDDRKRGYAEQVEVIREYLGARYGVATLELTTAELLRALSKLASDVERGLIAAWLERCDLVRYGGYRATAGDARGVLADARALIVATTARPQQEAA